MEPEILHGGVANRRAVVRIGDEVLRPVGADDEAYIEMWNTMGGAERNHRRRQWLEANRDRFLDVLG